MPLTWHQQRGVERRLGLHRWLGEDDGFSCLHCGTYATDDARDTGIVPLTCSPNDARYHDEYRDFDYVPHRWCLSWERPGAITCTGCGLDADEHTYPDDLHAVSCLEG